MKPLDIPCEAEGCVGKGRTRSYKYLDGGVKKYLICNACGHRWYIIDGGATNGRRRIRSMSGKAPTPAMRRLIREWTQEAKMQVGGIH